MSSNNNSSNIETDTSHTKQWLWKPGQSGNPLGNRVGKRNVSLVATLRRKVESAARDRKGKEISDQLIADQIVNELIHLALHCKVAKVKLMAIVTVLDRLEGKPVTPIAVSPAELELVQRVRLAYDAVLRFAETNGLQMSPAEAVAWVAAREPRAREILADVLTIDVEATTDGEAGTTS